MAEFDIASKVKVPEANALEMIGKVTDVGKGLLTNRMLGQEVDSKMALGKAVTAATDTTTGKTDWNKALSLLAQDEKGAWKVPEFSGQVLDRGIKEQQFSQEQLKTALAKFKAVQGTVLGLISNKKDSPLTADNVKNAVVNDLFKSGILHQDDIPMASSVLEQLGPDLEKNLHVLMRMYTAAGEGSTHLESLFGKPALTDAGGSLVTTRTSPATGETELTGTAIPKGIDPSKLAELVEVTDPATGEKKKITLGEALGIKGTPTTGGGVTTSLAPGQTEALTASGLAQQRQGQAVMEAADAAPNMKGQLKNLRDEIGQFSSGPKATWIYKAKALATQFGLKMGEITDEVAAQEQFAKTAQQMINANTSQLGEGTDSKLTASLKASPNEFLSKQGALGILGMLEGQEDAKIAKAGAWQKWLSAGNKPDSYGKFQTEFNKLYNPRVFQAAYMSDGQKAQMFKGMSDAEKKRFEADWKTAKKFGWIQ